MKVFLGGTVATSKWRDYIMPKLDIDYYNPVVEEWTEEDYKKELHEREHCDFCLYVISPKLIGWYSLAEVTDDSLKRSDKTIYCYLPKDEEKEFSESELVELQRIGELIESHGALWLNSLDEIIDYLNSANKNINEELIKPNEEINDMFISYGRRHSLAFARKLHDSITKKGFTAWFDMNDIPLGVDFQEQIDDGIRRADNFIYIMSPHSINSIYCYKELILALQYNKRIIPILHVEPQDDVTWSKIDPEAGKRNWIYMRQNFDTALKLSTETFEIKEKILETPESDWNHSDDYKLGVNSLIALINSHKNYVRTHTTLLDKSLDWQKESRSTLKLLVGKERQKAEDFLRRSNKVFKNPTGHIILPPCNPTDLIARYIMESKKNGNNMQCDIFVCHDVKDDTTVQKVTSALAKHGFSSWLSSKDITKGEEYNHAIHNGMVQSSNMLFFLSQKSLKSDYCKKEFDYAIKYNKRIIPILIDKNLLGVENPDGIEKFPSLKNIQYIDFTDLTSEIEVEIKNQDDVEADVRARREKTPFEISVDELVHTLDNDHAYYESHRVFLVQALRWKERGQKQSFLLRGFNLENAKTWVHLNKDRENYKPLDSHKEFIENSDVAKGQFGTEVFVSYSRKDGDFARILNQSLQSAGKTTWFDQESISKGVDFEKEIYKGIDGCNNFVFIISPDAIDSEYCEKEVEYAAMQNKRIITLLVRETQPDTMPEALRVINWIDFTDGTYDNSFSDLVQAIELDQAHTSIHTLMQQRAIEWKEQNYIPDFLLNATACNNVEDWLSEAYDDDVEDIYNYFDDPDNEPEVKPKKTPAPTNIQIKYIKTSREELDAEMALEQKKQKRLKSLSILSLITATIAIVLFVFALIQTNKTREAKVLAEINEKEAVAANKKSVKIIDAFYFYDNKFALAMKIVDYQEKYGFIDKHGNVKIEYIYDEAYPYENFSGLAKVKRDNNYYFIDTTGTEFLLADDINKLQKTTKALDLRKQNITKFPSIILSNPQLQILLLSENQISELPQNIAKLKNLKIFSLSDNKLEKIPTSIGTLRKLEKFDLSNNQLNNLPKTIWKLKKLTYLSLADNNLDKLSPQVGSLNNLLLFDITRNNYSALPAEIERLTHLKTLLVEGNKLTNLPKEIGKLIELKRLDADGNLLKTLPSEIGNLINLTELDLDYNQLTVLPPEIWNLTEITELDLDNNLLKSIPSGIKKLTKLKELDLKKNKFIRLNPEIVELTSLSKLEIGDNQIKSISSRIFDLKNLTELDLKNNLISNLPPEVGHLYKLKKLDVSGNKLIFLPMEINHLENLTNLYLQNNKLNKLQSEILELTSLLELNLQGNKLTVIPEEIQNLTNLTNLCLVENNLSNLPIEIINLSNLKELNLRANNGLDLKKVCNIFEFYKHDIKITSSKDTINTDDESLLIVISEQNDLPSDIGKLENLIELDMKNNQFSSLPSEISNLLNLKELDLSNNKDIDFKNICLAFENYKNKIIITTDKSEKNDKKDILLITIPIQDSLPVEIGNLQNLISLDLSFNKLTFLPKEIGKLKNLTTIYLDGNKITELPVEFGNLSNLTTVSIGKNKLTNIPEEFWNLTKIKELNLSFNKLTILQSKIQNLKSLSTLDLNSNELIELPKEFWNLKNLVELSLSNNNLTELSAEVGNLNKLTKLYFDSNQITNITGNIGNLSNLIWLSLGANKITSLPKKVEQLTNLEYLYMYNNPLTELENHKIEQMLPNCYIKF